MVAALELYTAAELVKLAATDDTTGALAEYEGASLSETVTYCTTQLEPAVPVVPA